MSGGCEDRVPAGPLSGEPLAGTSRLSGLLGDGDAAGYARATESRAFAFPADHGPHEAFRNEWWYLTGNLDGAAGERLGFELTFFRFSLAPETDEPVVSSWRTNQVYIAHFAISDVDADEFYVAQRYSRGAAGLAGATPDPFSVWIDDWSVREALPDGSWLLTASDADFGLRLRMAPLKPPILNGIGGLSQKSDQPGNASYYYSIPRLQSSGTVRIGDNAVAVQGLAWLDREWSSSALSAEQRGWDWFALQLSNGCELMYYQLRRNDGSVDVHSAGTWIDAQGNATYLQHDDVVLAVSDYWTSSRGGEYPAGWQVRVESLGLNLDIVPAMADQELVTNVRYWEGAVDIDGVSAGEPVSGRGYVELTGYADSLPVTN